MFKKLSLVLIFVLAITGISNAELTSIPTPPESTDSYALEINDNNITVGYVANPLRGFIYDGVNFTVHESPYYASTIFYSVNNNGIVTGYTGGRGVLYDMNTEQWTLLPFDAFPYAVLYYLNSINDNNLVAGYYRTNYPTYFRHHPLVYYEGDFLTFDHEDYLRGVIYEVNNFGEALAYFSQSPTQPNVQAIIQLSTNPLSYQIIEEFTMQDKVPQVNQTQYVAFSIDDSKTLYGELTQDGVLKTFKYNMNTTDFEIMFTQLDVPGLNKIRGSNNIGDVVGTYRIDTINTGFIWTPPVPDIVETFTPNVFKLLIKDTESRFITNGYFATPDLDIIDEQPVNVKFQVVYEGVGIDGADLVIELDEIQTVIQTGNNYLIE